MTKVEAIVIRERIETVIDAVEEETGHVGVTVIEAVGHGRERGVTHEYRGRIFESRFLPKAMLVFGEIMGRQGSGCIVNASSMAARRALSGVLGYAIAKAGVEALTAWLAADLARRYGDRVRVNAVAPGFFVTEQNRNVLLNPDPTAPTPSAPARSSRRHPWEGSADRRRSSGRCSGCAATRRRL